MTVEHPSKMAEFLKNNRFLFLFVVQIAFYILTPVLYRIEGGKNPVITLVGEGILFLGLMMGAVISVTKSPRWLLIPILLGLPTLCFWIWGSLNPSIFLQIIRYLCLIAFLSYVIFMITGTIFHKKIVTQDTVFASLCVYMLLGLVWALAYSLLDLVEPESFTYTPNLTKPSLQFGKGELAVLYYSFVTLTTMGYGDIIPTTSISRVLASFEAITGQLYLAVLVSKLVGMYIVTAQVEREHHKKNPGPQDE